MPDQIEEDTANASLAVSRFRVRNFKAIRDSGTVHFTPLTAFIGNNGAGKSSLIEALEMVHDIAHDGLNDAMSRWRGFGFIRNQSENGRSTAKVGALHEESAAIEFEVTGASRFDRRTDGASKGFNFNSSITTNLDTGRVSFLEEDLYVEIGGLNKHLFSRYSDGVLVDFGDNIVNNAMESIFRDLSILSVYSPHLFWQFVRIQPEKMMAPHPLSEIGGKVVLATDGSNIAEYLLDIRERDKDAFDGILETLRVVLPYAEEIEPVVSSEIGRNGFVRLREQGVKDVLPAWLLSTGTLRVVALLALLRHPEPPPLIVIEEIENGLDPRTLHLIVEEIRDIVASGRSQIILTTHSPYLLDLLPLESLVLVERVNGEPKFIRPADDERVQRWSKNFAPGKLYTMGRLRTTK